MPPLSGVRRHSILSKLTKGYPGPGCAWTELSTRTRLCKCVHLLLPATVHILQLHTSVSTHTTQCPILRPRHVTPSCNGVTRRVPSGHAHSRLGSTPGGLLTPPNGPSRHMISCRMMPNAYTSDGGRHGAVSGARSCSGLFHS